MQNPYRFSQEFSLPNLHLSLFLFVVGCSYLPEVTAEPQNASSPVLSVFSNMHQCEKNFYYDIFLVGAKIGYQQRTIKWSNQPDHVSATIESSGEVKIFGIGSHYQQVASLVYSNKQQQFLSRNFHQISTGINARNLIVSLSDDGKNAEVNLDGKDKIERNNDFPLYDIDTMGAQIRLNLFQQKSTFTLYRLSSKKIKKYSFKVMGEEKIKTEIWGDINAIRINEVGKYKKMVLWFSPKHDLQMVKANIDAIISPTVFLTKFNIECK